MVNNKPIKSNMKKETTYFWLLRKSGIFKYWHKKFLTELMFDLELYRDIEQKEIEEKYRNKLNDLLKKR